ncbi:MAG TPA: C69 family dipeptidase [Nevskiales bacterium]|nr:C69 family dipeptidase [Nevskiales bacterium]
MCDTQVLLQPGVVWFAKNSDREPSEPQPVVRLPAVRGDATPTLRCTYLEIPQVRDRHGVILSKPKWIWGAEMGANDQGVVIGNEAVFTRVVERRPALLGMDLLRLGLERGASARAALGVITTLLERHGQGGPAGYRDKRFCYDNSFIIADAREAWVLETAQRHWVAKRVAGFAAISNCLTIGADFDLHSAGLHDFAREHGRWNGRGELDFARAFDTYLLPYFGRAHERRELALGCLAEAARGTAAFGRMAAHLRRHAHGDDDPLAGSNADLCLHAVGFIRRSQTTGAQISRLAPCDARHVFTGSSAPCLSLFRPANFDPAQDFSVLTPPGEEDEAAFWWQHERLHRRALFDTGLRARLRAMRDTLEPALFAELDGTAAPDAAAWQRAEAYAREWDRRLAAESPTPLRPPLNPAGLYWRWLNRMDGLG